MKVPTQFWGDVDARYHRDAEGVEWLLCPSVPWGYLLPRDLRAQGRWDQYLGEACAEASRPPAVQLRPYTEIAVVEDAPAAPRKPGRQRKVQP